jgi:DNA invertase Pin-like site-specific DNA recombinase
MKNKKYGISYIRFSTAKQALGNSYDRQFEETEQYCRDNGIELIKEYKDLGRSAYKSFNLMPGSDLAFFLKKLKNGEIPNADNTFLILESLDRLSRANVMDSLPVFMDILKYGVSIVTLIDKKIYHAYTDVSSRMTDLIGSVMMLSKAHQESLDKSFRVGRAWQDKKEKARKQAESNNVEVLTKMCPFWLGVKQVNGKLKYIKKEDYTTTIQLIFDLATGEYSQERFNDIYEGKLEKFEKLKSKSEKPISLNLFYQSLSSNEIVKVLNTLNIPILKSGKRKKTNYWNTSNINRVLINTALTGVYQPKKLVGKQKNVYDEDQNKYQITAQNYESDGEEIENFYPIVIDRDQFIRAQRFKTERSKGKKGRKGKKFSNLLNGLVICRNCKSNIVHNDKGTSKSGKRWVYLQCSLARSGGDCEYISANYDIAEYNLLRFMQGTDFSPVIGSVDQDQQLIDIQTKKVENLNQQDAELNRLFKKYIEADYSGFEDVKEKKISELQGKKKKIQSLLIQEENELTFLISNKISEKFDKNNFKRLVKEISLDNPKLTTEEIYFNRMKANSVISNLIERVQVDTIAKKLLLLYKDGSGQVINIDRKYDDPKSSVISIKIPKFIFPADMNDESKGIFNIAIDNYCMRLLDFMYKLKEDGKYTAEIRKKLYYSRLKEITKYLEEQAISRGYSFKYDKVENSFHFK